MKLLLAGASVYLDNASTRSNINLYISGSAQKHMASDEITLRQAFKQALGATIDGLKKKEQETNVFRFKINNGKGYLVYKLKSPDDDSACLFHYHWNYTLDLPLTVL
jgi:hypothetical protein